jgi:hypothetical protein
VSFFFRGQSGCPPHRPGSGGGLQDITRPRRTSETQKGWPFSSPLSLFLGSSFLQGDEPFSLTLPKCKARRAPPPCLCSCLQCSSARGPLPLPLPTAALACPHASLFSVLSGPRSISASFVVGPFSAPAPVLPLCEHVFEALSLHMPLPMSHSPPSLVLSPLLDSPSLAPPWPMSEPFSRSLSLPLPHPALYTSPLWVCFRPHLAPCSSCP